MTTNYTEPGIENTAENNNYDENEINNDLNNKKKMVIDIDKNMFSDEKKKGNKKPKINPKFMNKDFKNTKNDPFENSEVQVKEPHPKVDVQFNNEETYEFYPYAKEALQNRCSIQ